VQLYWLRKGIASAGRCFGKGGIGLREEGDNMAFTINIHYTGANGSARAFMREMIDSGTVDAVRAQLGNLRYEYYLPVDDDETVMLVDCWESQDALDAHHASPMMATIAALRDKYGLTIRVERFEDEDTEE
jgi:quinol monooxygenase YgiN